MISKELLSEVLSVEMPKETCFKVEYINSIEIQYYDNDLFPENRKHINIYELAHKCKEWARGRYSISSYPTYFGYGASLTDAFGNSPKNLVISTKTECGAIFKACEWIMNQN